MSLLFPRRSPFLQRTVDAHFLRAQQLTGFDFRTAGCRVPVEGLKKPAVDGLPEGFSFGSGATATRIFCGSANRKMEGYDLTGYWILLRGAGAEGGITIRDCLFTEDIGSGFQNVVIDRGEGSCPNVLIEYCTIDHHKTSSGGKNTFRPGGDNAIIRYCKFMHTGQDIVTLGYDGGGPRGGSGLFYRNLLFECGYGFGAHCDAIAVYASLSTLDATTASARRALIMPDVGFVRLRNPGTVTAYVAVGDASIVATTGGTAVAPGATVDVPVIIQTHIAAITSSGATQLHVGPVGWLIEENFIDQRNPGDIPTPVGTNPWPINNTLARGTPNAGHFFDHDVYCRNNIVVSRSNRMDFTNGYIIQYQGPTLTDWANDTAYSVGDNVYDPDVGKQFTCRTAHTSPPSGTFSDYREANPLVWIPRAAMVFDSNWTDPVFGGGSTGCLGVEHPLEPPAIVHHNWLSMWGGSTPLIADRNWPYSP